MMELLRIRVSDLLDEPEPSVDDLEVAIGALLGAIGGCPPLVFDDISGNWLGRNSIQISGSEMTYFRCLAEKVLVRVYPDDLHATLINMILGAEQSNLRITKPGTVLPTIIRAAVGWSTISPTTAIILFRKNKLHINSVLWCNLTINACHAVMAELAARGPWRAAPPLAWQMPTLELLLHAGQQGELGSNLDDYKAYVTLLASSMYIGYFMHYVTTVVKEANLYSDDWIAFIFGLLTRHHAAEFASRLRMRHAFGFRYGGTMGRQWQRFYTWVSPVWAIITCGDIPPDLDELGDWIIRSDSSMTYPPNTTATITNAKIWEWRIARQYARRNFALMVMISDDYFRVLLPNSQARAAMNTRLRRVAQFFSIATRLPIDLQQVLAWRMLGRGGTFVLPLSDLVLQWTIEGLQS